jgi:hypothetical protein
MSFRPESIVESPALEEKTTMAKSKRKKNSSKKGRKSDRARISGKQPYEVYYVAQKFGVSADTVRAAIKKVGNMRAKVYAELERHG